MKRLLVVDDALLMRKLIRDVATQAGWEVAGEAANGAEAVALYQRLRPDLVTMDIVMPEMGGLQATRLIKAQDAPPYVVIASHFDDAEHREHALRAGADAFVSKLSYIHDVMPLLEKLAGRATEVGATE